MVISLPGVVSVKFHNPNNEGVCWIYREDTAEFFGAWKRPASTNDWVSRTDVIMVDVAGEPSTGSF